MHTFPSLDAFIGHLATLGGYHLTSVRPWESSCGSAGSAAGVDVTYTRVVDGTTRAVCRARLLIRRYSYGLSRIVDDGKVTADFGAIYGAAIYTNETRYPAFSGTDLGSVAL